MAKQPSKAEREALRKKLSEMIKDLLVMYGKHPFDINRGDCHDFALRLEVAFGNGATAWWGNDFVLAAPGNDKFFSSLHSPGGHAFLVFDGMFYDAETPYGVESPALLPVYQRQLHKHLGKNGLPTGRFS